MDRFKFVLKMKRIDVKLKIINKINVKYRINHQKNG